MSTTPLSTNRVPPRRPTPLPARAVAAKPAPAVQPPSGRPDDFSAPRAGAGVRPSPPSGRAGLKPTTAPGPAGDSRWTSQFESPEAVQNWISQNFSYDPERQQQQSNPDTRTPPIHPTDFVANPTGACMDLANFGVATVNAIDPNANAQLMQVDMAKTNPDGSTTTWKHWIGVYQNDEGRYVGFADSRGKGNTYDGPDGRGFETPQALMAAYQAYWNGKDNRRGDVVGGTLVPPRDFGL